MKDQTLDERMEGILRRESAISQAIAEIKAAILAEMPEPIKAVRGTGDGQWGYMKGYNQAITEITEKLK